MRISATVLESFRLYMTQDWMEEADLMASLKGEFTPTHPVQLGAAYHAVLEHPERYRVPHGYRCEGFEFADDVARPMLDLIDRDGLFEVKATRDFHGVTLVAKADQLIGAHVNEFKTTLGTFDADKYLESYQWRVMALVFQPVAITYRVACLSESTNGVIALRSVENVTVYPYASLEDDCGALLAQFGDYVRLRGLDEFLRERQRVSEAA